MRKPGGFCVTCLSTVCLHSQVAPHTRLTNRQITLLRALVDPSIETLKGLAFQLGIAHGTLKVYLSKIYRAIGWTGGGSVRNLTLWVIAHRKLLDIALPTPEQFTELKGR